MRPPGTNTNCQAWRSWWQVWWLFMGGLRQFALYTRTQSTFKPKISQACHQNFEVYKYNSHNILSPWLHSIPFLFPLPQSLLSFHQRTVGILPPNPLPLWQSPCACSPVIRKWAGKDKISEGTSIYDVRRMTICLLKWRNHHLLKHAITWDTLAVHRWDFKTLYRLLKLRAEIVKEAPNGPI